LNVILEIELRLGEFCVCEGGNWVALKSERIHFDFSYVFEAAVVCNVVLLPACLSSYTQSNWLYIGRIEKNIRLLVKKNEKNVFCVGKWVG
jgi:hypothetical protein